MAPAARAFLGLCLLVRSRWELQPALAAEVGSGPGTAREGGSSSGASTCSFNRPLFKEKLQLGALSVAGKVLSSAWGWVHGLGLPTPFGKGAQETGGQKLECLRPFLMNCTNWHDLAQQRPCSDACPYVAELKPFACTFICVAESQCHVANKQATFANPATLLCEDAKVEGCWVSNAVGRCRQCRKHFKLEGNGTLCTLGQESTFLWLVQQLNAMRYGIYFLVALALVALCWQLKKRAAGHWDLLTLARIHHHLCKLRKSPKLHSGAPLYSLFENVHTEFLIGVGLPLYYNSLVFLFLLSLVFLLVTHIVLDSGDSSVFTYATEVADPSTCNWATSRLTGSGIQRVYEASYNFMGRLVAATLILYVLALLMMLAHAKFQLQHADWFDSRHLTMKDLALKVNGLPASATDEAALARSLSEHLGVEVVAVSIAYDFADRMEEVQALIDRHLAYADVEARGCYPAGVGVPPCPGEDAVDEAGAGPEAMERSRLRDRERVRAWFAPEAEGCMLGTGHAFVIFSQKEERDRVLRAVGRTLTWCDPGTGDEHELQLKLPKCEPTNVNWGNLGCNRCRRLQRFAIALTIFLGACGALAVLIFWPYALYVTSYLKEAGTLPRGLVMGTLGTIVGISWWLMCVVIGTCVGGMGLHTVENEMIVVFIWFTHFCVGMSAFNVYLTWFYTRNVWDDPGASWRNHFKGHFIEGPVLTLRDIKEEIDLGYRIFQLLVPGMLFTPCLVGPLQNVLLPYVRESLLLVLLGKGKSGREAERYLEPLPMGLPWDYQGHVTLPFCCCLTLFIMSPSMWWTQVYLCVWCVFFYGFQRVMHLRICKKMFFTSNKLDCLVLYLGWGLLLAELAACHAYWRVRRWEWPWWSIPIAVVASYILYWSLLRFLVGVQLFPGEAPPLVPQEGTQARSGQLQKLCQEVCYNWLNVNPVYVLKSQYCEDILGGMEPVAFYDAGKEYLQLASGGLPGPVQPQRQGKHWARWTSMDRGIALELEGMGCIGPFSMEREMSSEFVPAGAGAPS